MIMNPKPEYILDSKWKRGTMHYLVKWKELPHIEATWVTRRELKTDHCALLNKFHQSSPTTPKPHTMMLQPRKHMAFIQPDYEKWD